MLANTVVLLALAATGFSAPAAVPVEVPTGYKTVYISSMVDAKFVIVPKAPAAKGSTLVVQTLTSKPDQQWYVKADNATGKIQLAGTTLCLDAGAKAAWKDMAAISLTECADTVDGQKWVVMTDGRIALQPSSPQECIDLQYMKATANNPVGLYSCAGLGNTGAKDKGINWPLVNVTATPTKPKSVLYGGVDVVVV